MENTITDNFFTTLKERRITSHSTGRGYRPASEFVVVPVGLMLEKGL